MRRCYFYEHIVSTEHHTNTQRFSMRTGYTREELLQDFIDLGIRDGDTLFIHASFKSLGPVVEGAGTVIAALEGTVGTDGLLLMPTFSLLPSREERVAAWNIAETPSTVGWLTEYFRQMPDTYRSDHYSHAVAARGREAETFVAGHREQLGYDSPWDLRPWGKTYGTHSPMFRAYRRNAKLLMLGVDYQSSTYIHLVEVLYWNKRLTADRDAPYIRLDRPALGTFWESVGAVSLGQVGDSRCRLFHIQPYVDTLLAEVEAMPALYVV